MWIMILGVPSLIVWIIGMPTIAFIILLIYRDNLMKVGPVKRTFLVLYQGLKKGAFYWEFVNTIRKVVLLFISTVLSIFSVYYTALVSVLFLFILTSLQIKIQPYEDKRYNKIEIRAITAGTMTLFCGVMFDQDGSQDKSPLLLLIILILLIAINLMFIIEWLYLFIRTLNIKNIKVQLFLQLLASLIFERHEFQEVQETKEKTENSVEANENKISRKNSASIEIGLNDSNKSKPLSRINKYHGGEGK